MPAKKEHILAGACAGFLFYTIFNLVEGYKRYKALERSNFYFIDESILDRFLKNLNGAVRYADFNLVEAGLSSVVAALVAALPDKLEPATNPNHREFFHSYFSLVMLLSTELKIINDSHAKYLLRMLASVTVGGYSSHLLLDAFTEKGLPII